MIPRASGHFNFLFAALKPLCIVLLSPLRLRGCCGGAELRSFTVASASHLPMEWQISAQQKDLRLRLDLPFHPQSTSVSRFGAL